MTTRLRDYYAGMALQGLVGSGVECEDEEHVFEDVGRAAVEFADATLKAACAKWGHAFSGGLCQRCSEPSKTETQRDEPRHPPVAEAVERTIRPRRRSR